MKLFPRNESTLDRTLRVVLGVALVGLAVAGPLAPWGYIGLVPLVTGALGSCPVYTLLGIGTCRLESSKSA